MAGMAVTSFEQSGHYCTTIRRPTLHSRRSVEFTSVHSSENSGSSRMARAESYRAVPVAGNGCSSFDQVNFMKLQLRGRNWTQVSNIMAITNHTSANLQRRILRHSASERKLNFTSIRTCCTSEVSVHVFMKIIDRCICFDGRSCSLDAHSFTSTTKIALEIPLWGRT